MPRLSGTRGGSRSSECLKTSISRTGNINKLPDTDKANKMETISKVPKIVTLSLNFDSSLPCLNLIDTNLFYLPAKINGHECEALIDLGSNATVIDVTTFLDFGFSKDDIKPWRFGKISTA